MNKRVIIFIIVVLFILLSAIFVLYLNQVHGYFIFSVPILNQTYLTLRFDDALVSQEYGFEVLKKNNLTGSIYVITSKPESNVSWEKEYYLGWNELREYSSFMEIGSHTRSHVNLLLSPAFREEITLSKQDLISRGFNVSTFVYPGGNYDKKSVDLVSENYECASTQDVGTNVIPLRTHLIKDFTFRALSTQNTISRVIKPGRWNVITIHDIGFKDSAEMPLLFKKVTRGNSISPEMFDNIVQYIKDNNITVITLKQGCDLFKNEEQ